MILVKCNLSEVQVILQFQPVYIRGSIECECCKKVKEISLRILAQTLEVRPMQFCAMAFPNPSPITLEVIGKVCELANSLACSHARVLSRGAGASLPLQRLV